MTDQRANRVARGCILLLLAFVAPIAATLTGHVLGGYFGDYERDDWVVFEWGFYGLLIGSAVCGVLYVISLHYALLPPRSERL